MSKFSERSKFILNLAWANDFLVKSNYDFLAKITGTTRKDISIWLALRRYAAKKKQFPKIEMNAANQKLILECAWEMDMLRPSEHRYYDALGEFTNKGRKGITIWAASRRFKERKHFLETYHHRLARKRELPQEFYRQRAAIKRMRRKYEIPIIPKKEQPMGPEVKLNIPFLNVQNDLDLIHRRRFEEVPNIPIKKDLPINIPEINFHPFLVV